MVFANSKGSDQPESTHVNTPHCWNSSNEGPDQMVCPVASDLELQCLPMPYKKDTTVVPTKSDSDVIFCLQLLS